MKQLLLLLATLLGLTAFSQTPFSIGINSSIDLTSVETELKYAEPWIGYQIGVRLKYDLNKNFALTSGFNHQNKGSKVDFSKLKIYDNPKPISLEVFHKIIQIPLLLSLYMGNKIRYGFSLGLAYNYMYRANSSITFQDKNNLNEETKRYTSQPSIQFVSGLFSFGAEYNVNRVTFRVEPNITYKFFDLKYATLNYLNFGLGGSVYYRLK